MDKSLIAKVEYTKDEKGMVRTIFVRKDILSKLKNNQKNILEKATEILDRNIVNIIRKEVNKKE